MKALKSAAFVVAIGLLQASAEAKVSEGYWSVTGPVVSSTREGWNVCRRIVRDISPVYSVFRVLRLSSGRIRCWYSS